MLLLIFYNKMGAVFYSKTTFIQLYSSGIGEGDKKNCKYFNLVLSFLNRYNSYICKKLWELEWFRTLFCILKCLNINLLRIDIYGFVLCFDIYGCRINLLLVELASLP